MKTVRLLTILILFLPFSVVLAADITINSSKTALFPDEEFPVNVILNLSAADNTVYYLRGAFYKPGTTNYCGYTWNGTVWFKGPYSSGEGWKNFLPITINSGQWSGELKAKIDPDSSYCRDTGNYNFRIQRFTTGGSGTFDTQNELTVFVNMISSTPSPGPSSTPLPTPTPSLTPTLTPSSTSSPNPTLSPTPSSTPTPSLTPTVTPTHTPTPTSTPTPPSPSPTPSSVPTLILTPTQTPVLSPTPTATPFPIPDQEEIIRIAMSNRVFVCFLEYRRIKWIFGYFHIPRIQCGYR